MNFPNLFVVSYGRTGSTVLMGILNAIPGYLIRGENADLVGHLMAIAEDLRPHASETPTSPRDAWFGGELYTEAALVPAFRALADRLLLGPTPPAGVRCYGFKEIRYSVQTAAEKIGFLEKLYPGAGFIFSVRDSARVARSEFQNGLDVAHFDAIRAELERLAQRPNGFVFSHDELVTSPDALLPRLFEFLGEPYDARRVKALLETPHGYSRPRPDGFVTDFPFHVRAGVRPAHVEMLYINRFERGAASVIVGGFTRAARFSPGALRERGGHKVRQSAAQPARMQGGSGEQVAVTNFLMEIDCPANVDQLDLTLPNGDVLFELRNLRHLGRDLGRRG